ncbi:MAG TPA: tRNA lysidine(34) synthetase TilS [Xanthobacteraceae bacterium]|nr:tRNA lysidine(34) synthetase TilS [Xanthobacteraceae bacterium]
MPTVEQALRDEEASALFDGLAGLRGLLLAVSGGSDSTALLVIAARWAKKRKRAPKLLAVTVDHGLRPEARREAAMVKRLARRLGVPHRTLRWRGRKPKTGLQEAARIARYSLLAQAAVRAGYEHILTAHTLDDQAETVLLRLARGSGLTGLAGMAHASALPVGAETAIFLVRPLLRIPKSRLVATLKAAGIGHSEDASNRDPRFTRARLRMLMPALAREGLDARGLMRLAMRMRRAEATIEFAVGAARAALAPGPWRERGPIVFDVAHFRDLPAEVALRLLGRAVAQTGDEGPVELGKLEQLYEVLRQSRPPLRRTLAGALITLAAERLTIERAPARRRPAVR